MQALVRSRSLRLPPCKPHIANIERSPCLHACPDSHGESLGEFPCRRNIHVPHFPLHRRFLGFRHKRSLAGFVLSDFNRGVCPLFPAEKAVLLAGVSREFRGRAWVQRKCHNSAFCAAFFRVFIPRGFSTEACGKEDWAILCRLAVVSCPETDNSQTDDRFPL